jgi:glycine C-acetyltransferase
MSLISHLRAELDELSRTGTLKVETPLRSPQGAHVDAAGRDVIMLTSNNYLGLANHPEVVRAAKDALDRWGNGLASVRFICGTQELHKELEAEISGFFGTEDTILYSSCWAANEGLFQTILGPEDALVSDELNHASIIDGIRLCKAERFIYKHNSLADLEHKLKQAAGKRHRLVMTDGVFSMEGELAPLPEIRDLCRTHDAVLVVDDSHATGVIGKTGRGTAEELGIWGSVDVYTSTLGKAMGSASGGFTTGPREVVEILRQRSRPYLFSNTLPPSVAAGSLEAFRILRREGTQLMDVLAGNTRHFRTEMKARGFTIPHGNHPIVPVIVGDTALAIRMSKELLEEGVYVSGFGFPVVPKGQARLRAQISAALSKADLDIAIAAFEKVAKRNHVLP